MVSVSLFVGQVQALRQSGRPSGIYKTEVKGPIELGKNGFAGDHQADTQAHGGPEKAVHSYPAEHYVKLAAAFPDAATSLVAGSIGENISTKQIDEHDVHIGDIWQLGTAQIQVCQPRNPCWKIDERFECDGMAAFIDKTLLTGWYWRVVQPGVVSAGDVLSCLQPANQNMTLHGAMTLWREHRPPLDALERLSQTPGIASSWRDKINQRLTYLKGLG